MNWLRFVVNFYRTQIELLWHWRLGRGALIKRAIVALVAGVIAFNITAWLLPQLDINELGGGLIAVIFISALNLLVRPVLLALVASRSVVALVILTLLFQAVVILLLDPFVPAVDRQRRLHRRAHHLLRLRLPRRAPSACCSGSTRTSPTTAPWCGRSPAAGRTSSTPMPRASWSSSSTACPTTCCRTRCAPAACRRWPAGSGRGTHQLGHWNALLPSTTPASQAGILHGNNDGIPNFRWWEKKNGRLLVANHPEDATEIERRISNGEGLLSPGGASISNIFTGDGDRAFLVMSTIKVKERGLGESDAFAWFFVSPYNYITMIAKYIAEVVKENIQSRRQARAGIEPRMHRGFPYPWVRGATNVALRALGTSLVIQEMLRGTPVIYMDYTDYDEIAHHSGPERPESLDALDGVDRELKTLLKAAEDAPRPYRFVILADHGQSLGATFLQRYGVTLQDVVRSLMGGKRVGRRGHGADRGLGPAEHVPGRGVQDQGRHRLAGPRRHPQQHQDGAVEHGSRGRRSSPPGAAPRPSRVSRRGPRRPAKAATRRPSRRT